MTEFEDRKEEDEVEGRRPRPLAGDDTEVEGHRRPRPLSEDASDDEPEVEGHRRPRP